MQQSGGFYSNLPFSTPPSSHASSSTNTRLPQPRSSPLKAGGSKQSALVRYVDQSLLRIQRRFAKRQEPDGNSAVDVNDRQQRQKLDATLRPGVMAGQDDEQVSGYSNFAEAAKDLDSVIDVIWISGTPSIQIPYLLNIALTVCTFVSELPPSPRSMFGLLAKLDVALASLLTERNVETREVLPGFKVFGARGVNSTESVRMKSIVDRTRILVVDALRKGPSDGDEGPSDFGSATETEDDPDEYNMTITTDEETGDERTKGVRDVRGDWDMEVAKVYDRTLIELGTRLAAAPIGIISEP